MAYHTKRLRVVQYASGAEGVAGYKAKHPEARSIQTRATTIAFQPKPKGYSDFICGVVDSWFISDVAITETNKATVARLNEAMHPRRFNPDSRMALCDQMADERPAPCGSEQFASGSEHCCLLGSGI
jgi:hypothetical protein